MSEMLRRVLAIIDKNDFICVKDLTKALGVSRGTTDRYLQKLEKSQLIKRVQGGALSLHKDFEFCPKDYYSDTDKVFYERRGIAQKAVEMVHKGDTLFVGGGRNTLHFAKELKDKEIIVDVVTNSLHVALLLAERCHVSIVGTIPVASKEGILIGQVDDNIMVNKAFIAPSSATDDGFYNATSLIIQLERAFAAKAKSVTVLADSEIYSTYRPYRMLAYDEVNMIVTPKGAPAFIENKNVKICYV